MATGQVAGYGDVDKANVFRLLFTVADLSAAPRWEAYDNSEAFPARTEPGSAVASSDLIIGTTGNGDISCIGLAATTNASPGAGWLPAAPSNDGSNPNRLKGTTSYVNDPTTPSADDAILYNMVIEIPSDMEPSDDTDFVLQCRYAYTGAAPTLTWQFNNEDPGTGTEAVPDWDAMTPGTEGVRHSAASATATEYYANIPVAGVEPTEEAHVVAA